MKTHSFLSSPIDFDTVFSLELKGENYLFNLLKNIYSEYCPHSDEKKTQELKLLEKSFEFGKNIHKNQKRESGATYFTHPLIVALLITPYKPCVHLLIATMLHDTVEDSEKEDTADQIKKIFGEEIFLLIEGVSKVTSLNSSKEISSLKTIQKLFLFAKHDSRTLLIKIFDRLHNIITLKGKKKFEKRIKKVQETMNVFIPTIERLGLWKVKKDLENASMKALYPKKYEELKKLQQRTRILQNISIENIKEIVVKNKKYSHIPIEAKCYSASSLLRHHNNYKSPDESFFFIRCIVKTQADCYELLSILSSQYYQKKKETRDYISTPKENGYKALQSTFIIDNAHAIRIHVVSEKMKERNDNGIFIETHQKNFSLPFLELNSKNFQEMRDESEQFFSFLTGDLLVKKIKVHNKEKGDNPIPFSASVLGAGIYLFPEKFQYISECFINGKKSKFFTLLKENDIVEFSFSSRNQCKYEWRDYVNTPFSIKKIIKELSKNDEKKKKEWGQNILQKIFDKNKWGTLNDSNYNLKKIINYFSCQTEENLYISLAEGRISKHKIYDYIYEENQKKFPFWKKHIAKYFPWFFSEKKSEKVTFSFSSHLKKLSDTSDLFNKYRKRYNIKLLSSTYNLTKGKIFGSVHIESPDITHQDHFISDLQADPRIKELSFFPPLSFIFKIIGFFIIPFLIAFAIFMILIDNFQFFSPIFFYFSAFFIAFSNAIGYSQIAQYFSSLRHNRVMLLAMILFNISITGFYVWSFIKKGFDIYHLDFYFPLLVIIFSMAFPILFFKQKKIMNLEKITITEKEFKEKQKQKIIGYLIRIGAVIIWGTQPLITKYSPIIEMDLNTRVFYIFLGGVIISFLAIIFLKIFGNKKHWNPKITINKYLILSILSLVLISYCFNSSLNYTTGTSFILLNNFAPILALLVAMIFWRNQIPYLKSKKNIVIIFLLFLLGGIGSSFLFYNDILYGEEESLLGNLYALGYMLLDVLFTISLIQYSKLLKDYQSYFVNFWTYLVGLIIISIPLFIFSRSIFFSYNFEHILWILGLGLFVGVGIILNYEAFRRMDGFIAFLMFNISILITFTAEAFIFNTIPTTWILFFGSFLIITASILAEKINTKCEREQIEEKK